MAETIIHIYEGKVFLNPEPEPESDPANEKIQHYWDRLAEWKKNCKLCENAEFDGKTWTVWLKDGDEYADFPFTPGQKVLAEGSVVKQIL